MAAADAMVLAHREHGAALGVRERRVIEVLADVVLVLSHGAVVGEREVLGVDQVERQRRAAPTFSSATCQNHAGALAASRSETAKRMPCQSPRAAKPSSRIR